MKRILVKFFLFPAWLLFVIAMIIDQDETKRLVLEVAQRIISPEIYECNRGDEQ